MSCINHLKHCLCLIRCRAIRLRVSRRLNPASDPAPSFIPIIYIVDKPLQNILFDQTPSDERATCVSIARFNQTPFYRAPSSVKIRCAEYPPVTFLFALWQFYLCCCIWRIVFYFLFSHVFISSSKLIIVSTFRLKRTFSILYM